MRVTLINPGLKSGEGAHYGALTFPLVGIAYLATHLRQNGFEIQVIEVSAYRLSVSDVRSLLVDWKPQLVGVGMKSFNVQEAYDVAQMVRDLSPDVVVVFGGPHASALVEHTFGECAHVDAIVRGEGEATLLEVCQRLSAGHRDARGRFADILGLSYRADNGQVVHNPNRPLMTDLDQLPFPDYSLYDLRKFGRTYDKFTGRFESELSIFASRGCPFCCCFCQPHLGRRWRSRSPDNVVAEVELNMQRFGVTRVCFNDSTFGLDRRWFHELCELLRARGLHRRIHWVFETRADLAAAELLEDAVSAGAVMANFGFESGSDVVLKRIGKGICKQDILSAVSNARQAGVPAISGSFIFGLPFETRESIRETLELLPELRLDFFGANIVSIYPGTELWDMVDRGIGGARWRPGMRMNWSSYDRNRCQIEVNDLTHEEIESAAFKAKDINRRAGLRSSWVEFARKCNAYLWYLLLHDRKKLAHYFRSGLETVVGRHHAPRAASKPECPGSN